MVSNCWFACFFFLYRYRVLPGFPCFLRSSVSLYFFLFRFACRHRAVPNSSSLLPSFTGFFPLSVWFFSVFLCNLDSVSPDVLPSNRYIYPNFSPLYLVLPSFFFPESQPHPFDWFHWYFIECWLFYFFLPNFTYFYRIQLNRCSIFLKLNLDLTKFLKVLPFYRVLPSFSSYNPICTELGFTEFYGILPGLPSI